MHTTTPPAPATPTPVEGRTWTARVAFELRGATVVVHATHRTGARNMRDTGNAAVEDVVASLRTAPTGTVARVYLDKTTRAHGTVEDRQFAAVWSEDGKVHVDRW